MKVISKFLELSLVLSIAFSSCGKAINEQLKKEMETIKSQCPIDHGQGVMMTDVNFYDKEKILEYIISIEGIETFDDVQKEEIRKSIIEELSSNEESLLSTLSLKMILKQGYSIRYIYTDTDDNVLTEIILSEKDLP